MKTAMQELLDELKDANSENNFIKTTINLIIDMVESKLEKEKQQIIDAVNHKITPQSVRNSFIKDVSLGEHYYNETFGEL